MNGLLWGWPDQNHVQMSEDMTNTEDKVWVTITRTINLGNYENIKVEAGMSQTLKAEEDPTELISDLSNRVFEEVLACSKRYKKKLKQKKPKRDDNS